jgi:hypothetical protein
MMKVFLVLFYMSPGSNITGIGFGLPVDIDVVIKFQTEKQCSDVAELIDNDFKALGGEYAAPTLLLRARCYDQHPYAEQFQLREKPSINTEPTEEWP